MTKAVDQITACLEGTAFEASDGQQLLHGLKG